MGGPVAERQDLNTRLRSEKASLENVCPVSHVRSTANPHRRLRVPSQYLARWAR
jgi:hypothetical protein